MLMVPAVVSQLFELTIQAPRARDKLVAWLSQYESATSIADELAEKHKETEQRQLAVTAVTPAIDAQV